MEEYLDFCGSCTGSSVSDKVMPPIERDHSRHTGLQRDVLEWEEVPGLAVVTDYEAELLQVTIHYIILYFAAVAFPVESDDGTWKDVPACLSCWSVAAAPHEDSSICPFQ